MKYLPMLAATAALTTSTAALAEGPAWTYVDLGYLRSSSTELDSSPGAASGTIDKSQGYVLDGSFGFAEIWHAGIYVGTAETKIDGAANLEIDTFYNVRVGLHPSVTDNTDFVAEIGYTTWDFATNAQNPSGGIGKPSAADITVGVRSMLSDRFELSAFLSYFRGEADIDGISDKFQIFAPQVGGQFFFTDNFSINLDYTFGDLQSSVLAGSGLISVSDTAKFGLRWSFN